MPLPVGLGNTQVLSALRMQLATAKPFMVDCLSLISSTTPSASMVHSKTSFPASPDSLSSARSKQPRTSPKCSLMTLLTTSRAIVPAPARCLNPFAGALTTEPTLPLPVSPWLASPPPSFWPASAAPLHIGFWASASSAALQLIFSPSLPAALDAACFQAFLLAIIAYSRANLSSSGILRMQAAIPVR